MTKTKAQKARSKAKQKQQQPQQTPQKVIVESARVMPIRPKSMIATKILPQMGGALSNTVLGMTLPHAFSTPRLSTVYADVPTAIANPFLVENVDWTSPSDTTHRMIPKGTFFMAASRSPLQALVRFYEYPPAQESAYLFQFPTPDNDNYNFYDRYVFEVNQPTGLSFPYDVSVSDTVDPHYFTDVHWTQSGFSHPHGYRYFTVDANGRKGFWVNNDNSYLSFEVQHYVSASDMSGDVMFRLSKWDGSTWARTGVLVRVDLSLSVGSVVNLVIPSSGYWAIDAEIEARALTTAAQVCEYTIKLHGIGPQFGYNTLPKIENVESSIQSMRTTALSLMLTQRAPVMAQGGQVTGVQLPSGEAWHSTLGSDDPFDELSNYTGAITKTLDTGIYGFLKPASQPEFDFFSPFEILDGDVVGYKNPIEPPGSWIVVCANVSLFTGSYAGGLCHLTASYGIEFVTDNIWFSSLPSSIPPDAFTKALMELKATQQWHENPMHFKELLRAAMTAGKNALKMAPTIAKIVGQFMPGVNPSVAVVEALSKLGHAL